MKLEVSYYHAPIDVLGRFEPIGPTELKDYTVKIDGKICPSFIRDLILMGMSHQAGITGQTFGQVMKQYLAERGI